MKASGTGSKQETRVLNEILSVLLRIEEFLHKRDYFDGDFKSKKPKKQLLND
jgi:hypothetical protein